MSQPHILVGMYRHWSTSRSVRAKPGATLTLALVLFAAVLAAESSAAQSRTEASGTELVVTTLGTGTPAAVPDRFGYSNLVQAGGLNLLFDAGRGAVVRINQMGVRPGHIDAVFITHFHSDHTNGLADVFMMGYLAGYESRNKALLLFGPEGITRLAEGIRLAHLSDIETRMLDENVIEAATHFDAREVEPGIIFEKNDVNVTMFEVNHGEKIKPAVGYRIDYGARSAVLTGDTKYDQRVINVSQGADLLIHPVAASSEAMSDVPWVKRALAHHISPREAGRVFEMSKPRLAVYSHVVSLDSPEHRLRMTDYVEMTRETYRGPLVVAEDLMQFRIDEQGIAIVTAGN